jgi:sulfur transfer protein SufE
VVSYQESHIQLLSRKIETLIAHVYALEEAAAKNHTCPVDGCESGFNRSDHPHRICRSSNAVKKDANITEGIFSILVKVSRIVSEQNASHLVGFSDCELSAHRYQGQNSIENSFQQKVPIAAFT